jgi:Phosphotransferase enzyme family
MGMNLKLKFRRLFRCQLFRKHNVQAEQQSFRPGQAAKTEVEPKAAHPPQEEQLVPVESTGPPHQRGDEDTQARPSSPSRKRKTHIPITMAHLEHCQRVGSALENLWRINETTIVKYGNAVRMAEAAAMRLVRDKTSVPVPKVDEAYMHEGTTNGCIVMQFIDGTPLNEMWHGYAEEEKKSIVAQLRGYLLELRQVDARFIGSVDGSYCQDPMFANRSKYGPFETESSFKSGLVRALRSHINSTNKQWVELVTRFVRALPQKHRIVLTHGNLLPHNIIMQGPKIVALVNWELSGFYPEYWEYVKSYFYRDWESPWFSEGLVDKVLDPYPLELGLLMHAMKVIS